MSGAAEASGAGVIPDQPDTIPPAEPVSAGSGGRIASLDFVRGVAVLGILAANIIAFGQPFMAYMWPEAFTTPHGETSNWMWVAQFVLIDGKMRGLFTLLFGAGMMLFLEKAWSKGSGRSLQARRLFWLLIFGMIHFYLIWRGDILILYSIAGFAGLLFVRLAAKTQIIVGLVGYVLGSLLFVPMMAFPYLVAETEFGEQAEMAELREDMEEGKVAAVEDATTETAILTEGSYADYVSHNVTDHRFDPLVNLIMFVLETLPLTILGMGLFRIGLFSGGLNARKQKMWGWIGVIGGSLLTMPIALWALNGGLTYWGTIAAFSGLSPLPRLPMILGLAALLSLWGAHATGWLGVRLAAAGRVAFSNYLGTSIMMTLLFHGWAIGLWGELNRPMLYVVVLGAWVVMLAWSKPWLERFRYGPLEWLWRCLTYWKLFPLKR